MLHENQFYYSMYYINVLEISTNKVLLKLWKWRMSICYLDLFGFGLGRSY